MTLNLRTASQSAFLPTGRTSLALAGWSEKKILGSDKAKESASGGRTSGRAGRGSIARALTRRTFPSDPARATRTAGVPSVEGPSVGDLTNLPVGDVCPASSSPGLATPEGGVARAVVVEARFVRELIREGGRAVGSDRIARANRTGDGARAVGRFAVARRPGLNGVRGEAGDQGWRRTGRAWTGWRRRRRRRRRS